MLNSPFRQIKSPYFSDAIAFVSTRVISICLAGLIAFLLPIHEPGIAAGRTRIARPLRQPVSHKFRRRASLPRPLVSFRHHRFRPWSLADAPIIQKFFHAKFGRQLPISAYGQTRTHTLLGFDHSNSMDVALHPDTVAGKDLIGFLRARRIPFIAFRRAVESVATGPHIHVGYPSRRIPVRAKISTRRGS